MAELRATYVEPVLKIPLVSAQLSQPVEIG